MAIQKDLYLEWRKRCLFLSLFFFFLMETNDLAWLGLYSDFFFFYSFHILPGVVCSTLFQKNKNCKNHTKKRGFN